MAMYGGIDLHSNNLVLVLVDGDGQQVRVRKLATDLSVVLDELRPFGEAIQGLAVESTYNWYWLVDGLHDAGYRVALANTRAIQQYDGLKFTDDRHDARWLAELLRLGVLPEGHICPREERAVRDLLRHRMRLVQERTGHILSIQNLVTRNTGRRLSGNRIKTLTEADVEALPPNGNCALPVQTNLALMRSLDQQIATIEASIRRQVGPRPEYKLLQPVAGVGEVLGQTILLETGSGGRQKPPLQTLIFRTQKGQLQPSAPGQLGA